MLISKDKFLSIYGRILPPDGFYNISQLQPEGAKYPWKHVWADTLEEVYDYLVSLEKQNLNTFIAQASFKQLHRVQSATKMMKSFWLDIDCGEEKVAKNPNTAYLNVTEAIKDIGRLHKEFNLPLPVIVSSGHGLYAHWVLTEPIYADQWKSIAEIFKKFLFSTGFKQDPKRTADEASVLRPVGCVNRKDTPVPVTLLKDSPDILLEDFVSVLKMEVPKTDCASVLPYKEKKKDLNEDFRIADWPTAKAVIVAERCAQLRHMRDTRGNIEEPLWYACIGLMRHCEEGNDLIHEWSSGYEGYSFAETQKKIEQHKFPPTTCEHFELNNPSFCLGCPRKGEYTSPIQAGIPAREKIEIEDEDRTKMPKGFSLTAGGLEFAMKDNEPGKLFYEEDMYPIDMAYDRSSKQMISKWLRKDKHEGWKEFSFRSALTKDPKAMAMTLQDNNIIVVGKNNLNIMIHYLETYMKQLNDRRKARQISNQLGWQDFDGEQVFVLGDKVFYQNGTVINSGFTSNSPEIAKYFKAEGYIDRWVRTTQLFRNPSMLPHAFLFLASAFASPLIRFTGHEGATMSIWGKTGAGKSLIVKYGISAYGQPKELIIRADDTPNALINRVGVYNSLPVLLDEITTMKDELLGDLIYRITGGRDKLRLNRNASERASINRWNTLCFTTSNTSTVEKLGGYKGDPEAQINRVLEYELPDEQYDYFSIYSLYDEKAKSETSGFDLSYGGVAEPYIKYLLEHYNEHADKLRDLTQKISAVIGAQPQERFWLAMIATTLYGGAIAKKLGLIDFPLEPVKDWIFSMYPYFRGNKAENRVTAADFIGDLLSKYVKQILRLNNVRDGNPIWLGESGINQQMVGRYERQAQSVWISKNIIRQELLTKHMNYITMHRELSNMKPYAGVKDEYKNLGEGTPFSGTLQPCWKINLKCPQFGHIKVEEEKE